MSKFFGNFVDNLKSNRYINSSIETLKQNTFINKGIEVCVIAKDVYQQVRVEDEENKKKLEDYYLDSKSKVKKVKPQDILNDTDYKIVKYSAKKGRRIRRITKKTQEKLVKEYKDLKKQIQQIFKNLREKCANISSFLSLNVKDLLENSPEKLNQLLRSLKNMTQKFYRFNVQLIKRITECLDLTEVFNFSREKLGKLKEIISSSSQKVYQIAVLNLDTFKTVGKDSLDCFMKIMAENKKLVVEMLSLNGQILSNFFQKVDYEFYYSKDQSVKPVSLLRGIFNDLSEEKKRDEQDELVSDEQEI